MQVSEILQLSVAERIQIVADIWDSIALESDSLPLTEQERKELDERLRSYRENPNEGISWNELQEKLTRSK